MLEYFALTITNSYGLVFSSWHITLIQAHCTPIVYRYLLFNISKIKAIGKNLWFKIGF